MTTELTEDEQFGVGVDVTPQFDLQTSGGSIATTGGVEILNRDVSFALSRRVQEQDILDTYQQSKLSAQIGNIAESVAADDSRIASIETREVIAQRQTSIEVNVAYTTIDDTRGELVFSVIR